MRKVFVTVAFSLCLLVIQAVVWSCSCGSFRYDYHYRPDRIEIFSQTNQAEKDSLNVDWVRRGAKAKVTGNLLKIGFIARYEMVQVGDLGTPGLVNTAYADCLPDFYYPGDTLLSIDVLTTTDLEGVPAGQSILDKVGWDGTRIDSLIGSLNYGLFPQEPSMRFNLTQKPVDGKLQLLGVMVLARAGHIELLGPEIYWD